MSSEEKFKEMSNLLLQRDDDCKKMRLHSLFEYMYEKDANDISQEDSYSPSVVRKARAMTVPPLQDIYEDTMLYPSKWVSPTLTRKDRRERLKNQKVNEGRTNKISGDTNNNINSNDNDQIIGLKTTEAFSTKFVSLQEKRSQFAKHVLGALPEDTITRSFEEEITDNERESMSSRLQVNTRRPRSWTR